MHGEPPGLALGADGNPHLLERGDRDSVLLLDCNPLEAGGVVGVGIIVSARLRSAQGPPYATDVSVAALAKAVRGRTTAAPSPHPTPSEATGRPYQHV